MASLDTNKTTQDVNAGWDNGPVCGGGCKGLCTKCHPEGQR